MGCGTCLGGAQSSNLGGLSHTVGRGVEVSKPSLGHRDTTDILGTASIAGCGQAHESHQFSAGKSGPYMASFPLEAKKS